MATTIINFLTNELFLIFILNLITSALSQLKYILATKDSKWQMYLLIAIDSVFYLYSLTLVMAKNSSFVGITVLTVGKLLGITVSNFIEKNAIHNEYAYEFFFSDLEFVEKLEEHCHNNEISITRVDGWSNGIKRYILFIHLNNSQERLLFKYLKDNGIENPTANCTEIKKSFGKLKQRLNK